jgi:hypothetical protein
VYIYEAAFPEGLSITKNVLDEKSTRKLNQPKAVLKGRT